MVSIWRSLEAVSTRIGGGSGDARAGEEWIAENRPNVETEILHGGQSHYPFLFGVE